MYCERFILFFIKQYVQKIMFIILLLISHNNYMSLNFKCETFNSINSILCFLKVNMKKFIFFRL